MIRVAFLDHLFSRVLPETAVPSQRRAAAATKRHPDHDPLLRCVRHFYSRGLIASQRGPNRNRRMHSGVTKKGAATFTTWVSKERSSFRRRGLGCESSVLVLPGRGAIARQP